MAATCPNAKIDVNYAEIIPDARKPMKLKKCPTCGSGNIVRRRKHPDRPEGTLYDACRDCLAIWESIPEGEQYKRDGEMLPFHEPCDNCAFRPGSPESQDKEEWKKLMAKLRAGGQFFCHKGVPLVTVGEGARAEFNFPKRPDGEWDRDNMRLCQGYCRAWSAWMRQQFGTYENPKPQVTAEQHTPIQPEEP